MHYRVSESNDFSRTIRRSAIRVSLTPNAGGKVKRHKYTRLHDKKSNCTYRLNLCHCFCTCRSPPTGIIQNRTCAERSKQRRDQLTCACGLQQGLRRQCYKTSKKKWDEIGIKPFKGSDITRRRMRKAPDVYNHFRYGRREGQYLGSSFILKGTLSVVMLGRLLLATCRKREIWGSIMCAKSTSKPLRSHSGSKM